MSNTRKIKSPMQRLSAAAQDIDVAYFMTHPEREYSRPATPDELRAAQLPPGTTVHVQLVGEDIRLRAFEPPDVSAS